MSYEPTNWKSGDTVTSAKLNKMEQGIANAGGGGGAFIVNDVEGTLDKTWQEIFDAMSTSVAFVSYKSETEIDYGIVEAAINGGSDEYTINAGAIGMYTTDSADGYPAVEG